MLGEKMRNCYRRYRIVTAFLLLSVAVEITNLRLELNGFYSLLLMLPIISIYNISIDRNMVVRTRVWARTCTRSPRIGKSTFSGSTVALWHFLHDV
jgi:hypothetical protein